MHKSAYSSTLDCCLKNCTTPAAHRKVKQSLRVPEGQGSQISRQLAHEGGKAYVPAAFTPRKYSSYSFLLETESTPGPWCGRKDYANRTCDLPACSAMSQTNAPPRSPSAESRRTQTNALWGFLQRSKDVKLARRRSPGTKQDAWAPAIAWLGISPALWRPHGDKKRRAAVWCRHWVQLHFCSSSGYAALSVRHY